MAIIMKRTEQLYSEGKTYDLFYNNKKVCKVTLEKGNKMTQERAFQIINDVFINDFKMKPRKHINKVSFVECSELIEE